MNFKHHSDVTFKFVLINFLLFFVPLFRGKNRTRSTLFYFLLLDKKLVPFEGFFWWGPGEGKILRYSRRIMLSTLTSVVNGFTII